MNSSATMIFLSILGVVTNEKQFKELFALNLSTNIWPNEISVYSIKEIKDLQQSYRYTEIIYVYKNNKEYLVTNEEDHNSITIDVTNLPENALVVYQFSAVDKISKIPTDIDYISEDDWFSDIQIARSGIINTSFVKGFKKIGLITYEYY